MTEQHELDRLMAAFFVEGTNELPDRVIDAALDEIDHTRQRRRWLPRRFSPMTTPLRLAAAALIGVLVIGGVLYYAQRSQADVAHPNVRPAWTLLAPPAQDLVSSSTTLLRDGRLLLAGGSNPAGASRSAQLYDPATNSWMKTGAMRQVRGMPAASLLADGRVLVTGQSDTAELFDPTSGTWTFTAVMAGNRDQSFAALLRDGRVLVAGGNDDDTVGRVEIYDPAAGTWTATGNMTMWRATAQATLLDDGRVLVDGGFASDGQSAELFDPVSGTWTATARMHTSRVDEQTAVKLASGKVLVVGGSPTSGDIFDPATGTWTATSKLVNTYQMGAVLLVSALLPDGTVFLVGGGLGNGEPARAQRYDPATDTWTALPAMTKAEFVRSATLLRDGTVLIIGGTEGNGGGQPIVERFDPGGGS